MSDYYTREETDNLLAELRELVHSTEYKSIYAVENEAIARRLLCKILEDTINDLAGQLKLIKKQLEGDKK